MDKKRIKFNYVIGNPPYSSTGIVTNKPSHKKYYDALGPGGKHASLAFLMKSVDMLKNNGKVMLIIPTNGMVLKNSIGFRKYISSSSSITKLWITNKDVFRNKETNKLEACIQGNTFIVQLTKNKNLECDVETEYSNGLTFKTTTNYSNYDNEYFPLVLSKLSEICLNKCIKGNGILINDILMKGALHNNINNDVIYEDKQNDSDIKVMVKLNRGENIKYGWTDVDEGENRFLWKVVFSPICKVKEIMQYGQVSYAIIPSGESVQTNYSYIKANSKEEAEYIGKCLSHPLIVTSLIQLFDNAYINDSNLGMLHIPPYDETIDNVDEYIWSFFNIENNEKTDISSIYNILYNTEKNQMKKK